MSETGNWHLDRRVSVGHLVTTLTVLVAMVLWGARLETRIVLMEQDAARQARVDARQEADVQRLREEIREELKSLNAKMDRFFERLIKGGE
ncbi:MAG: hypothetical protein HZA24_11815 [Nitrospirae bacterium]|nr:hypothetical protein [Nitrospirota bacterium]